jgi:hypothetical protein
LIQPLQLGWWNHNFVACHGILPTTIGNGHTTFFGTGATSFGNL